MTLHNPGWPNSLKKYPVDIMAEALVPALFFQQKSYLVKISAQQAEIDKLRRANARGQVKALSAQVWMDFAFNLQMGRDFAMDTAIHNLFNSRKRFEVMLQVVERMRKRIAQDDDAELFDALELAVNRYAHE